MATASSNRNDLLIFILLLLFFLSAFLITTCDRAHGQGRDFWRCGVPSIPPNTTFIANRDSWIDTCNSFKVYYWTGSVWRENTGVMKVFNPKENDAVIATNPTIAFMNVVCPDWYGSVKQNKTFAQAGWNQLRIDTTYKGIGATINDQIDWACWVMALRYSELTGKPIESYGKYYVNRAIAFNKWHRDINMDGGGSTDMITTTTDSFAVFTTPMPVDYREAESICGYRTFIIENFHFSLQGKQVGLDPGPAYSSRYISLNFNGGNTGMLLRFNLDARIESSSFTDCFNGLILTIGNWPGAGYSNSQCNLTTVQNCVYYTNILGGIAFGVYASSNVSFHKATVQGHSVRIGIEVENFASTTDKDGLIEDFHFECIYGATEAAIKSQIAGGTLRIINPFGQYPAILCKARASAAYMDVHISYSNWWIPLSNKLLQNDGSVSWMLMYNNNQVGDFSAMPGYFGGTTPTAYCSTYPNNCFTNKWYMLKMPR